MQHPNLYYCKLSPGLIPAKKAVDLTGFPHL